MNLKVQNSAKIWQYRGTLFFLAPSARKAMNINPIEVLVINLHKDRGIFSRAFGAKTMNIKVPRYQILGKVRGTAVLFSRAFGAENYEYQGTTIFSRAFGAKNY